MLRQYCIKIMRGEKKSRLPLWFWGNLLCVKFISLEFSGTGEFGDAAFYSLKEIDTTWDQYFDACAKQEDLGSIHF